MFRGDEVGDAGRRSPAPGPVIPEVGPDPALLHALAQAFEPPGPIEHPHALAAPVDERRGRDLRPHASEDLVLSIQGQMVVELGDEDVRQ
jgi:hypothetical protein